MQKHDIGLQNLLGALPARNPCVPAAFTSQHCKTLRIPARATRVSAMAEEAAYNAVWRKSQPQKGIQRALTQLSFHVRPRMHNKNMAHVTCAGWHPNCMMIHMVSSCHCLDIRWLA